MAITKRNSEKKKNRKPELTRKNAKETVLFFLCTLAALFVNAVSCFYICESVARRNRSSVLLWAQSNPKLFWGSVLVVFAWSVFFMLLWNRADRGARTANVLLFLLVTASMFKRSLRGEPLLLTDFGQIAEAAEIMPNFRPHFPGFFVAAILMVPVLFPFLQSRMRAVNRRWLRIALPFAGLAFALLVTRTVLLQDPNMHIPYQYDIMYEQTGFVRGLWETRPKDQLTEPEDYGPERVRAVLSGYEGEPLAEDAVRPDIFFIMSESLFDLYRDGKLRMNRDPLALLKEIQEEGTGADYFSPNLGGGTFFSEYEVLTGYRAQDTPGALFNNHAATKEGMAGVVRTLLDAGYETTAIHAHGGSYYNRIFNYGRFGIRRMLFSDTGLPEISEKIGNYPKDLPLFRIMIEDYEKNRTDAPWFCHCVTYQNHGGYDYTDYGRRDVVVSNRSGRAKNAAENFLNGSLEHMEAVRWLLDYFTERERPVVVVLWGDHAPNIGSFGMDFGEGKATAPYYRTPLFVWNNYGADLSIGEEAVAAYRLGAIVLNRIGFRSDPYLNWLAENGNPDLVSALHMLEENGKVFEDDARYDAISRDMLLLHYDRVRGDEYWREAVR